MSQTVADDQGDDAEITAPTDQGILTDSPLNLCVGVGKIARRKLREVKFVLNIEIFLTIS